MTIDELKVVITAETAGLKRELASLKSQVSTLGKSTASAGKSIGSSFSGVKAQMQGVERQVSASSGRIRSALSGLGKTLAGAFAVTGLVNLGRQAVSLASDLQEVQNVVDTAFGEMSSQVEAWSKTTVDRFGMSELSAKQTASTYMAMSKGIGLAGQQAADMAMAVAERSGDIASFYNMSQSQADTMLKSIWTGETESLKQIGVVMTQANLDAYALANGFGKTTDAMSQSEQVLLRYQYVMQQTGLAAGDFEKTSGSWANQVRVLSERFKELLSILGTGLIQVLTPVIQFLNTVLSRLIEAATAASQFLGSLFGGGQDAAGDMQAAASGAQAVQAGLEGAVEQAKELKRATAGFDEMTILSSETGQATTAGQAALSPVSLPAAAIGDFAEPDTSGVQAAADKVKGILADLSMTVQAQYAPSLSAWSTALTGLAAPLGDTFTRVGGSLSTLWNETLAPFGGYLTGEFLPTVANAFSETFAPIFGEAVPVLLDEFALDFDFACQQVDKVTKDILQPAFEQAETVAVDVFGSIQSSWDEHGAGILAGFQEFRQSLRDIWDAIYGKIIKPVVDNIGGKLSSLWDKHLKPLWDNLTDFLGSVAEFLLTLWNQVLSPLIGYIVDWVAPKLQSVIDTIWSVISSVAGMIADALGGLMEALSGLMDFITGVFTGDWKKAWNGIKKFFKGIWDGIWGVVRGTINLIIDGLNMLWKGIYSVASGIVNGIGGIAGVIGDLFGQDWHFSMPEQPPLIPKLAKGGIVSSATAAVIGEAGREAVLPLENDTGWMDILAERIAQVLGVPGGRLVLQVGETVMGEVALRSLNALSRQRGGLDLLLV